MRLGTLPCRDPHDTGQLRGQIVGNLLASGQNLTLESGEFGGWQPVSPTQSGTKR